MENFATQPRNLNLSSTSGTTGSSVQAQDLKPLAIAGIGFFFGFAMGSGRTDLISRSGSQILEHTGSLILKYAMHAFDRARYQPEPDLT